MARIDCRFAALIGMGYEPNQVMDMLMEYYLARGAVTPQHGTAEQEFLINVGVTQAMLNDMWFELLRNQGYQGALPDMLHSFWCINGGNTGPGSPIPTTADFLSAYQAYTTTQNEGLSGNVCSLMPIGTLTSAAVHTDDILAIDYEGVYREFAANTPVWRGGRVVTNEVLHSENLTDASWVKSFGLTVAANGDGSFNVSSAQGGNQDIYQKNVAASLGDTFTLSVDIKDHQVVTTGTLTILITELFGTGYKGETGHAITADVTADFQRFTVSHTVADATSDNVQVSVRMVGGAEVTSYDLFKPQLENTTGRADTTTPSEYIKTTTAPVTETFSTLNGNTVVSNVVTEAQGADITPHPWLQSNAAIINYLTYSENSLSGWKDGGTARTANSGISPDGLNNAILLQIATAGRMFQNVTDTGFNNFSFHVKKAPANSATHIRLMTTDNAAFNTGPSIKVALTDDWQRIDLSGLLSAGAVVSCNIGSIDETDTNDPDCVGDSLIWGAQLEKSAFANLYVPTTTAAVTISATSYNHNLANIDTDNSATALEFVAEGESFDILTIGGHVLLSYGDVGDGVEMNPDMSFDTDSGWVFGAGGAISGGQFTMTSMLNGVENYINMGIDGELLAVGMGISGYVAGGVQGRAGLQGLNTFSSDGEHWHTFTSASNVNGGLGAVGTTTLNVDWLSVQKTTKGLILDDGTTRTTYPITAGDHTIGLALGTTDGGTTYSIQLTIDDVVQAERAYTPITAGLIDVDATHWLLRSESMLSYAEAKARVAGW